MNDRFKFRVWSKDSSQYIEKECHSCCLFHNGQLDCYNLKDGDCDCIYDNYPEDDLIIEQCTGLKDKNGKLIYEGDIILVDDDKCPVEWDSENARYNVVGYGEIAYLNYNDIEVIGNIHENADLLGEDK